MPKHRRAADARNGWTREWSTSFSHFVQQLFPSVVYTTFRFAPNSASALSAALAIACRPRPTSKNASDNQDQPNTKLNWNEWAAAGTSDGQKARDCTAHIGHEKLNYNLRHGDQMVCSIVFLRYQLLCHAIELDICRRMADGCCPTLLRTPKNEIQLLSDGIRHAKTTLPICAPLWTKKTI